MRGHQRSGAERANDILEDSLLGINEPMCNNDLPESGVAKGRDWLSWLSRPPAGVVSGDFLPFTAVEGM